MNLFKQRQNKRFNYTPRHQKGDQKKSEHDLKEQWRDVKKSSKHRGKKVVTLPVLLLILGMIIVIWYILSNYETK